MTRRAGARPAAATALVVLTSLLLLSATLAGYARRALLDGDQFANRATATLQAPAVRSVIADRVTARLVQSEPDLIAARPLIASAVSGVVGGGAFQSLFQRAALDAHRTVFERDQDTVALTVADVGTVAGAALRKLRPSLADQLERDDRLEIARTDLGSVTGDLARRADRLRSISWILTVLTIVAATTALVASVDRRRTAAQLGIGAVAAGIGVVLACTIGRAAATAAIAGDPEDRAAAGAIWDAFLGDLRTVGWLLAGCGAVVAAAATSLIHPVAIEGPLRALWRVATQEPHDPRLRVARALVLIAGGLWVILAPLTALQVATTLVGIYLLYKGLETVLRMIARPPAPAPAPAPASAPAPTPASEATTSAAAGAPAGRDRTRRLAVGALAALVVGGVVVSFLAGGGVQEPRAAVSGGACDGHASLCDRPLDEVVLPATHNSMSVPLQGWYSAEQDRPIAGQLDDGIRGLLLDTHYGDRLDDGRVRTDFGSTNAMRRSAEQDGVSPSSFEAAKRLRERIGFRGKGQRGIYLCHSFCELGATPLSSVLKDLHDFLVTHPSEVVVVVNQDAVTPTDVVKAFDDAGLSRYAFTPPTGDDWPTLRQMIDADRRLVVLAENEAGGAPWYQLVYGRLTQETPYTFKSAALLTSAVDRAASCKPNRGPASAPLLLINHWVSTDPVPRPSDAARVNAYGPLLARARACKLIRGRLPNLLAVNFYRRGDLFRVVDTLNGLG